jgi:hypothetical protein
LNKERGTQKQKHAKLVNKIRSHVDQGGVTSEIIQFHKKTIEVLESLAALRRRLLAAPDNKEDEDEPMYIENVRKVTAEVGREVDRYVHQAQASR